MLVKDILARQQPTFSFEFFPPKTDEGWERLFVSISELMPLKPAYVSVTYGAGGATREHTHNLVVRIQKETDLTVVSHLTCVGHARDDIRAIVERYRQNGIENILALRGDPPVGREICGNPRTDFFTPRTWWPSSRSISRRCVSAWPAFPRDIPAPPTACAKSTT